MIDLRADITDGLTAYAHRQGTSCTGLQKALLHCGTLYFGGGISIEWPDHYVTYAQAHPPKFRASRRKPVSSEAAPEREDSGSDGI
jgi:hypothetical protein